MLATPIETVCSTPTKPGFIRRRGVSTAQVQAGVYINVAQVSVVDTRRDDIVRDDDPANYVVTSLMLPADG